MATTIPTEFVGEPVLTPEKVQVFKDWYLSALGDSDKADDVEAAIEYGSIAAAMEYVLRLLHGMPLEDEAATKEKIQ